MGNALIVILVGVLILVDVGIAYYFLRREISAWRRGDNPWAALRTRRRLRAYRKRLLAPQPHLVEQSLGALLPKRLLALYNDKETILANEFYVHPEITHPESQHFYVVEFLPLDAESQQELKDMSAFGKVFCFARGDESYFWLPLNENRQKDAPVYQISLEDGQNIRVADSLEQFLGWARG